MDHHRRSHRQAHHRVRKKRETFESLGGALRDVVLDGFAVRVLPGAVSTRGVMAADPPMAFLPGGRLGGAARRCPSAASDCAPPERLTSAAPPSGRTEPDLFFRRNLFQNNHLPRSLAPPEPIAPRLPLAPRKIVPSLSYREVKTGRPRRRPWPLRPLLHPCAEGERHETFQENRQPTRESSPSRGEPSSRMVGAAKADDDRLR